MTVKSPSIGSRTTGTYGTKSKRIFRFLISVLEISTVFYRPLVVLKTKRDAHTAHARTHTNVSKHFNQTATARTTQNAESKTVETVAVFYTKG